MSSKWLNLLKEELLVLVFVSARAIILSNFILRLFR